MQRMKETIMTQTPTARTSLFLLPALLSAGLALTSNGVSAATDAEAVPLRDDPPRSTPANVPTAKQEEAEPIELKDICVVAEVAGHTPNWAGFLAAWQKAPGNPLRELNVRALKPQEPARHRSRTSVVYYSSNDGAKGEAAARKVFALLAGDLGLKGHPKDDRLAAYKASSVQRHDGKFPQRVTQDTPSGRTLVVLVCEGVGAKGF